MDGGLWNHMVLYSSDWTLVSNTILDFIAATDGQSRTLLLVHEDRMMVLGVKVPCENGKEMSSRSEDINSCKDSSTSPSCALCVKNSS